MNKSELLSAIASSTGLTKDQVNGVLDKYNEIVINKVLEDKEFTVLGLGKIKVVRRAERKAFNPKTKEPIVIPSVDAPKFSFARAVKAKIAEKGGK